MFFQHLDSGSYMKCHTNGSDTSVAGSRLQLTKIVDPYCSFLIEPRFKSKKKGDQISGSDIFLIKNEIENLFISYDLEPLNLTQTNFVNKEDPLTPDKYFFDPRCQLHKAFLTMDKTRSWTFEHFKKVFLSYYLTYLEQESDQKERKGYKNIALKGL